MARRALLSCIVLMALVAPMTGGQPSSAQSPGLYFALGDSITAGVGSSLPRVRSYPAQVQGWMEQLAGAPVPMSNLAVPGETATSFIEDGQLDSFRAEVEQTREGEIPIHAVTLSLGGNEILAVENSGIIDRQQALDSFRNSFEEAVSSVREVIGPDVPLVLLTYYDLTAGDPELMYSDSWWVARFNDVIRDVAGDTGALVAELNERFDGRIDELTYYPNNIHPTNRGYLAIAEQVWQTLDFDSEGPSVDSVTPNSTTRPTPTLSFQVDDNVGVESVAVQVGEQDAAEPLQVGETEYILLLDLEDMEPTEVRIQIDARDRAGNTTTVEHVIQLDLVGEAES